MVGDKTSELFQKMNN